MPLSTYTQGTFTFLHSNQIDALYTVYSSAQIKTFFDSQANELKANHNGVITVLGQTTDGDSGADNISMTPITETGGANKVQSVIEALIAYIKSSLGATLIGITTITGLVASNVQTALEALKSYIDNKDTAQSNVLNTHKSSGDHDGRYYTESELSSTTDGSSGADKIGVTTIPTLGGSTVQSVLESAKSRFDDIDHVNVNAEVASTHIGADGRTYETLPIRLDTVDSELAAKAAQADLQSEITNRTNAVSTEKSERLAEIAVERARTDLILANPGSTSGDLALNDIKIGANGITYDSPGNAVRGQYSDVNKNLGYLATPYNYMYNVIKNISNPEVSDINNGVFTLTFNSSTLGTAKNLTYEVNNLPIGSYTIFFKLDSTFSNMKNFNYCAPVFNLKSSETLSVIKNFSYTTNSEWLQNGTTLRYDFTTSIKTKLLFGLYLQSTLTGNTTCQIILAKSDYFNEKFNYGYIFDGISKYNNNKGYLDVYYFAENGNDLNDGLTVQTPKKNPATYINNGNAIILLKSGDVFKTNGYVCGSNLKIGIYGGITPAKIDGIIDSTNSFTLSTGSNLYEINIEHSSVGFIIIDGIINWKMVSNLEAIGNDEWYIDSNANKIYYYNSNKNVVGKKIKYSTSGTGIYIANKQNISLEGLEICNFGDLGIATWSNSSNISIKKCIVHDIGGTLLNGVTRYGNGIQIWLVNATDIIVEHNIVYNCFDAGITTQVSSGASGFTRDNINIYIRQNYIYNCAYPIEIFASQNNYSSKNVVYEKNYVRNCKDITEKHRLNANHYFYAQMVLWNINNPIANTNKNEVIIKNNICVGSESFSIAFHESDSGDQYKFYNNIFVAGTNTDNSYILHNNGAAIYLPQYYHGTTDTFVVAEEPIISSDDMSKIAYYSSLGHELLIN